MSLGDTDELWKTIERLAEGSSPRDIAASLILASFDALSLILKRSDITMSQLPDPLTEVILYQSLFVNRVTNPTLTITLPGSG
jgi:hypothetical protein